MKQRVALLAFSVLLVYSTFLFADDKKKQKNDDHSSCPMHAEHIKQAASHSSKDAAKFKEMNHRGNRAMGFSQEKTTHYFRILPDGGAIEVEANDDQDKESLQQVRAHMEVIAKSFTAGDFSIPVTVHDQEPTGVPAMKQLRDQIEYRYEQMDRGARVRIITGNPEALKSVQDFLRFQISEHRTGDPTHTDHKH